MNPAWPVGGCEALPDDEKRMKEALFVQAEPGASEGTGDAFLGEDQARV